MEEKISLYFRLITNLTKNIYKNIIFLAIKYYHYFLMGPAKLLAGQVKIKKLLTLASIKKILIVEPWPIKTVWKMGVFLQDIKALKVGCDEKCVQSWYRPLLSPVFFLLHLVACSPIAHWSLPVDCQGPRHNHYTSKMHQYPFAKVMAWWHLRQRTLGVPLQGQ